MIKKLITSAVLVSFLCVNSTLVQANCTEKYRAALEPVNREQNLILASGQGFYIPIEKTSNDRAEIIGGIGLALEGSYIGLAAMAASAVVWPMVVVGAIFGGVGCLLFGDSASDKQSAHDAYVELVNKLEQQHSEQMQKISAALISTFLPREQVEEMYQWSTAIDANATEPFMDFMDTLSPLVKLKPNAISDLMKRLKKADDEELFCQPNLLMKPLDFKLLMLGTLRQHHELIKVKPLTALP
jgi:hypothetical protein